MSKKLLTTFSSYGRQLRHQLGSIWQDAAVPFTFRASEEALMFQPALDEAWEVEAARPYDKRVSNAIRKARKADMHESIKRDRRLAKKHDL